MDRRSAEERFQNDPHFRALVQTMEAAYQALQFTPSEMREAAMFAAVRVEERVVRHPLYINRERSA